MLNNMLNKNVLIMSIVGMLLGLIGGTLIGEKAQLSGMDLFKFGIGFAILFAVYQMIVNILVVSRIQYLKNRRTVRTIERTESEGSFEERMEQFSRNVEQTSTSEERQSNMPLWVADDLQEYERTPPRPTSLIRGLLLRIQKLLGKK